MEKQENRDIDLMKIQIYADRSHTKLATILPFVFAVFLALYATLFTPQFQTNPTLIAIVWVVIIIFTFPSVLYILKDYQKDVKTISNMIELVKKGIELPKLEKITRKEIERLLREWLAQKLNA